MTCELERRAREERSGLRGRKLRALALGFAATLLFAPAALATPLQAFLDSDQEVDPPIPIESLAIGVAQLDYDASTTTLTLDAVALGLTASQAGDLPRDVVGFHIHEGAAGENGGIAIDLLGGGATNGWLSLAPALPNGIGIKWQADISAPGILTAGFCDMAPSGVTCVDFFVEMLLSDGTYLNVHTNRYGAGEIRGQIVNVPAPSTLIMVSLGLGGLAIAGRPRRRRMAGSASRNEPLLTPSSLGQEQSQCA